MTERFVCIAYIPFPDSRLRDENLKEITTLVDFVYKHEPDTLKYAVFADRDGDELGYWIFEEYTSRAALDAHRNSVPATSFGGQVFSVCDKERMRVMELEYQPGCRSDGREILNQKVPPFICAQLGVGATKLQQGVLAAVRDEALMHGVLRDTHDENRSVIIHVAKSEAAGGPFEEALDALTKQGVCHEVTRLTKLQGFLYR